MNKLPVRMVATIRIDGDPDMVQERVNRMTNINNQVSDEQRRDQIRRELIAELNGAIK